MLTLTNRIDMRPGAVPLVIHLGQYDSDFSLVFELYSSAGNFTVESGTTAMIRGTKTDGHAYDADATIDISAKTVTVAGNEQMTAAKGRNVYELVLKKGTKVLSTANFILDVERAAMDADTIASESVLKELNAIIAGAETATEAAADAASAADRAEDAAESVSSASAQIATNTADISDLKADLEELTPGVWSDDAKAALLACFENVAWANTNGQNYYNALYAALNANPVAPLYSIRKMTYDIGAIRISRVKTTPGGSAYADYCMTDDDNSLSTRARMHALFPAHSGTITAKSGYELVCYEFADIGFSSNNSNADDSRNRHGRYYCLDTDTNPPQWATSHTITNSACEYIFAAFRKTDQSVWSETEIANMYGVVFEADLQPSYRFFDIANFVNNITLKPGNLVVPNQTYRYVTTEAVAARAYMSFIPVNSGIFKSADPEKYKISVYQVNSMGGIVQDTSNPHDSQNWPSWADQYTISLDETSAVCISFKKVDGTNFTDDEINNMFGTVFTYEEV